MFPISTNLVPIGRDPSQTQYVLALQRCQRLYIFELLQMRCWEKKRLAHKSTGHQQILK
jgi:hypothetical protein